MRFKSIKPKILICLSCLTSALLIGAISFEMQNTAVAQSIPPGCVPIPESHITGGAYIEPNASGRYVRCRSSWGSGHCNTSSVSHSFYCDPGNYVWPMAFHHENTSGPLIMPLQYVRNPVFCIAESAFND